MIRAASAIIPVVASTVSFPDRPWVLPTELPADEEHPASSDSTLVTTTNRDIFRLSMTISTKRPCLDEAGSMGNAGARLLNVARASNARRGGWPQRLPPFMILCIDFHTIFPQGQYRPINSFEISKSRLCPV
jgi:hypothetical protein